MNLKADILGREELDFLIARNQAEDERGRPVYVLVGEGRCTGPRKKKNGEDAKDPPHHDGHQIAWTKRLHSKRWMSQVPPFKVATPVMRAIPMRSGLNFTEVEINARRR